MAELLTAPYLGLPELVSTPEQFEEMLSQLAAGNGPFAVDAERASGYRYSSRAYLIQIKRADGGLHLIDPIPFGVASPYFEKLNQLWQGEEVILHASTQDLPCLRELGLNPSILFDTELAGRLIGLPRVGLGALVESLLDIGLAKEHSAQDWSVRPLPEDWLNYAALDVELLIELRDEIEKLLIEKKKLEWARQEFAAILTAPPAPKRIDPWRRTSGMHKVKKRSQLAVVKLLWEARDDLAAHLDIAPGRVLSDLAISTIALASDASPITTKRELEKVLRPIGLRARWFENTPRWLNAIASALALPEEECPQSRSKSDVLPPIKIWRDRFPEKYIPLSHARFEMGVKASELELPVENLLTPEFLRQICWRLPAPIEVPELLRQMGAREWQIEVAAPILMHALEQDEPMELPEPEESAEAPE
ncbi:MAG: HRDC domain-containing protein [Candidatus Planktophila sp.]